MSAALPPILDADVIRAQIQGARESALDQLDATEAAFRDLDGAISALHAARDRAASAGRQLQDRLDRARRLQGLSLTGLGLDRDLEDAFSLPLASTMATVLSRVSGLMQTVRDGLAAPGPEPRS